MSPKKTIQNQLQNVMSDWGYSSVGAMWTANYPGEVGETRPCDVAGWDFLPVNQECS